ncbi:MAG: tripartite tricarboxylate transporter TctB family protein [Phreatobacter sp.]|nr:tripartite tricarboxylate transporter TctB family protein [Phreatobacter sp.]
MEAGGRSAPDRPVVAIGLGLVAVAAVVVWQSWALRASFGNQTLGPQMMPFLVGALLLLFGGMTVFAGLRGGFPPREEADWTAVAWIAGGLTVMILLIKTAGFVPACALLFAATARAFGSRRAHVDLVIGAAMGLAVYLFFVRLLGLTLPSGFTESWL